MWSKKIIFILFFFLHQCLVAQNSIKILTEKKGISFRGLSVPSSKVIWASGSKGTVARSIDKGNTFEWIQVKRFQSNDFRAIHAWNANEAIIVAIASPSYILKTKDGGQNWYTVYENHDSSMFLDAIHFENDNVGRVIGDPVNGQIILLKSIDKGENWIKMSADYFHEQPREGESFFASSNSNLIYNKHDCIFVSGGKHSRIWINGKPQNMPIIQGLKSTGANSISISPNKRKVIVVGGDFTNDTSRVNNIVGYKLYQNPLKNLLLFGQSQTQWEPDLSINNPNGYRSCVEFIDNRNVLTCGTSGVDFSFDAGRNWHLISKESFHVIKKQPNGNGAFLAGAGGKIAFFRMIP